MSQNYKNVFFGARTKKELDKSKEIVDNNETVETPQENKAFEPNHKAYSVIKDGKKFKLLVVDVDLVTMVSQAGTEGEYDSEARAIYEMNQRLAAQSRGMK